MAMTHEERIERVVYDRLARSARIRILAHGFAYPDPMAWRQFTQDVRSLRELGSPKESGALASLTRTLEAVTDPRPEYARLFLGRTPCPLNAAAYTGARQLAGPAADIADVSGFYLAFGLDLPEEGGERPDHLAAQLEFYSALLAKEAWAVAQRWDERTEITEEAAAAFLRDHLGRWQGVLVRTLPEHQARPPYPQLAQWLDAMLATELRLRGVEATPFGLPGPDPMQADDMTCPSATDDNVAPLVFRRDMGRGVR